jgi:hypothetical protein
MRTIITYQLEEVAMKVFQSQVKAILKRLGFVKCKVTVRVYKKKPALKLIVPVEDNGTWNENYRSRLNELGNKLAEIGLLWAADYPSMNHLSNSDDSGEPWMLFNGGEAIDLIPNPNVSQAILTELAQTLIVNDQEILAEELIKQWPNIHQLEVLRNGGGFHYSAFKINEFDVVLSNQSGEQAEFTESDWMAAIYHDFEQGVDPIVLASSIEGTL